MLNLVNKDDDTVVNVYRLITRFVRYYQPKIYKDYRGDVRDLAGEFFSALIFPTNSGSVLDSYDEARKVSMAQYLSCIVRNKLKNCAKAEPKIYSLSEMEHTDEVNTLSVCAAISVVEVQQELQTTDPFHFTMQDVGKIKGKWFDLSESRKTQLRRRYNKDKVSPDYSPSVKDLMSEIFATEQSEMLPDICY